MSYIRIFVGLGGFGSSVVQRLYKIYNEETPKENQQGNMQFVAYDSATHEKPKKEDFPNAVDFMKASPDTPQIFINKCKSEYTTFDKWWPGIYLDKSEKNLWYTNDLKWSGRGLGQYRPFGRLGFFKHLVEQPDNIITKIIELLQFSSKVINVDIRAANPRIILINSLAGGTGSSSFIDVAFLLKKQLQDIHANAEIILFSVMGDASMRGRAAMESDAFKWALANSYAALTELDYWESDNNPGNVFEYPRYGLVNQKPPAFDHVSIICQDNGLGKNLTKYSDYIKYLADVLKVIDVRSASSKDFSSVFDNILQHMKRYGSIGVGSIHYRYKDGLLYIFSIFAEEVINSLLLRSCSGEVKLDIEKELENVSLKEEGYYSADVNTLDFVRIDNIFDMLELSYEDERHLEVYFPIISLAQLDAKINHSNIQMVLRNVRDLDNKMLEFLNVKKVTIYDHIRSKIKSELFYNQTKGSKITISYIKEYLIQIKTIVDARIKGLERDIPQIFEQIHYKKAESNYNDKAGILEKKQNKKSLMEFRTAFKKYYEIKKFVYKAKTKLEIYTNLSRQFRWYLKAVDEINKPIEDSVLKHYRSVKEGLQLGTYSEYEKDIFTIYALSVDEYVEKYKEIYEDWKRKYLQYYNDLAAKLDDKVIKSINEMGNGIGSLLELYKTQAVWHESQQILSGGHTEVNYEKREEIKKYLKNIFSELMSGDFRGYINSLLPQSVIEALYIESKITKRSFVELLKIKRSDINNLVEPFIVLENILDQKELSHRTPSENLIVGKDDVKNIFIKYGNDQELLKSKKDIYDALSLPEEETKDTEGEKDIVSKTDSLTRGYTIEGHLEKITLLKVISGFQLNSVSIYKSKFKSEYEKLAIYESFTDIRLKPGKSSKEIVFLLAEYYGVIEVKEPQFKFGGKTLAKTLKGRENVIKWFTEERDTVKIKQIKKKLKDIWNKVPNSEKNLVFKELIAKLNMKKSTVKDEDLFKIIENNIITLEHAIDFKYYENIHLEFE